MQSGKLLDRTVNRDGRAVLALDGALGGAEKHGRPAGQRDR